MKKILLIFMNIVFMTCLFGCEKKSNISSFTDLYPIINDLSSTNVTKIEINYMSSGTAPMSIDVNKYFENESNIDQYLDYYKTASLIFSTSNKLKEPGGKSSNVIIYTNNGIKYELNFYENYLNFKNDYYLVKGDGINVEPSRVNYSFNINSVSGELYGSLGKVGNYSLDLAKIRFEHDLSNVNFKGQYLLKTTFGNLEFSDDIDNYQYIKFDNIVYKIVEGKDTISELIEFSKKSKLFYSLFEAFNYGLLAHEDLEKIASYNNNNNRFNLPKLDEEIATQIMKDFCEIHKIDYSKNPGSVILFGEYNGVYAVMVDGCGMDYIEVLTFDVVDGVVFHYGSTQSILVWKSNK